MDGHFDALGDPNEMSCCTIPCTSHLYKQAKLKQFSRKYHNEQNYPACWTLGRAGSFLKSLGIMTISFLEHIIS